MTNKPQHTPTRAKHMTYGLTRTDKVINTGLEFLKELIEKTDNSVMQANLCTIESYFEDVRYMHHSELQTALAQVEKG